MNLGPHLSPDPANLGETRWLLLYQVTFAMPSSQQAPSNPGPQIILAAADSRQLPWTQVASTSPDFQQAPRKPSSHLTLVPANSSSPWQLIWLKVAVFVSGCQKASGPPEN